MKADNCAEIRDTFLAGNTPVGPEVDAHIRNCAQCTTLLANHGSLGRLLGRQGVTSDDQALFALIERDLGREVGARARLQGLSTQHRCFLVMAACVALGALTLGALPRPVWLGHPPWRIVVTVVLYLLGTASCVWSMLRSLSRPGRPRVALICALVSLLVPLLIALWPPSALTSGKAGLIRSVLTCFAFGSFLSGPVAALIWFLQRERRPAGRQAALGAAAVGLLGNLVLSLHCAITDPLHIAFGHATIGLVWFSAWGLVLAAHARAAAQ